MKLQVVSLTGIKYDDEAYEVIIPTAEGEIAVYDGHMPLVSIAVPGQLTIRKNKSDSDAAREFFASAGGIAEISADLVRILVDEVERAEDILEAEAQAAFERAQKMKREAKNQVEIEKAQALMDRQTVRLHVAKLKRHHRDNGDRSPRG